MKATVMEVFEKTAKKHADRPALKAKRNGKWVTTTWGEYRTQVRAAAKALIHLGLQPGKGVSIIGFNCPEWSISDVATIYAGGCPAGIYTTNTPDQCRYVAEHAECQVAMVENEAQLAKFLEIRDALPELRAIVMFQGTHEAEQASGAERDPQDRPPARVYSWNDFLALGDEVDDATLQERIDAQKPDDTCTYIYTSGTTGDPKAVMITHDNITWTARTALESLDASDGDRMISYLPMSHIAEQVVSLHGPIVEGACTAFAESLEALGDNLKEVRPTIFLAVPRVWEKIQAKMQAAAAGNSGLKKKIAAWARGIGLRGGYAMQQDKPLPLFWSVAEKLVFSKVRDALGLDQCRIMLTSAAPISKSTLEFFLSLGLPIMEVYGMSECTGPATVSLPNAYRTGWVGQEMSGTELKIAEDGEICMRGRHVFKGYYKNPEATAETIDDEGWLHSGDIGELENGYLKITDRKKDLIITAGGENIAPQVIEGKLKGISVVSQAVVVGDRRKHLSALLTIDETKLEELRRESGSSAATLASAAADDRVHEWLMNRVEEVNKDLARVQTIKKIKILPNDLTIEGGELTPTMKVKRKVVNQKYADAIESLYA
ncbi:AMP-dependent synthetase/ligase [Paraliomyxa miuraensis]|uniref:AMP-dependent synthetase/ligase n=1 Tax=Paraliomyxa miuraensis TaxID=376150 RepID=UPI0022588FBB|nr:AMP-binding protein [Paraliomyxa miuraensis]MCX4240241.1 AMP-binding protein [Paraliomyxa miuraensis]